MLQKMRRSPVYLSVCRGGRISPNSFDVVWNIACTEHLFDRPRFFDRAASWLRLGGRMAICAWLAGNKSPETAHQVYEVCEGFLCPSLGTAEGYQIWMREASLWYGSKNNVEWSILNLGIKFFSLRIKNLSCFC
jgi:Methyltransferase domain.